MKRRAQSRWMHSGANCVETLWWECQNVPDGVLPRILLFLLSIYQFIQTPFTTNVLSSPASLAHNWWWLHQHRGGETLKKCPYFTYYMCWYTYLFTLLRVLHFFFVQKHFFRNFPFVEYPRLNLLDRQIAINGIMARKCQIKNQSEAIGRELTA